MRQESVRSEKTISKKILIFDQKGWKPVPLKFLFSKDKREFKSKITSQNLNTQQNKSTFNI